MLALAMLCAAVACASPTIPTRSDAYPFISQPRFAGDQALVIRWPVGTAVRVFVNGGSDATRAALLANAYDAGATMWQNAILFHEFSFVRAASVNDADVVLTWSDVALPVDLASCPVLLGRAVTTFCPTADLQHLVAFPLTSGGTSGVRMVVTVLGSASSDAALTNRLVAHELGHVLGLSQHSPNQADLMFATVLVSALSHADVSTIQVLYHTAPDLTP